MFSEDFSSGMVVLWKIILRLLRLVGKLTSLRSGTSTVDTVQSFRSLHKELSDALADFNCFGGVKTRSGCFPLITDLFSLFTAYRECATTLMSTFYFINTFQASSENQR